MEKTVTSVHLPAAGVNGRAQNDDEVGGHQLLPHHREALCASGLTDETNAAAGIYSVIDRHELAQLLLRRGVPARMVPALAFPFHDSNGFTGYTRVKPDNPRWQDRHPVKYESPRGRSNEIYFPPNSIAALADPTVPLIVTEGEKKSLAADQAGYPCIGLVGVYGWKLPRSEQLHPSMAHIAWQGRDVYIVFDSDRETNPDIRDAERRLALQLQRQGGKRKNRTASLQPAGRRWHRGQSRARRFPRRTLCRRTACADRGAADPEPPAADQLRVPAGRVDPRMEIQQQLEATKRDGLAEILNWGGVWWQWRDNRYVMRSDSDIRCDLVRRCNRHLSMMRTSDVSNLTMQLAAETAVTSELEPPCWLGTPPQPWAANEIIACRNQFIHLPSLANETAEYSIPATPKLFTSAGARFRFQS